MLAAVQSTSDSPGPVTHESTKCTGKGEKIPGDFVHPCCESHKCLRRDEFNCWTVHFKPLPAVNVIYEETISITQTQQFPFFSYQNLLTVKAFHTCLKTVLKHSIRTTLLQFNEGQLVM